jgi:hypothetical protein
MRFSAQGVAMEIIWQGRILGEFIGFGPGRVFQLSDGCRWRQESLTDEPAYREQPVVKLLRVVPDSGRRGLGRGRSDEEG